MVPQWIIEKKRDGAEIGPEELREFISAYSQGDLPDYQMAAFAMAVYFKGMSFEEVSVMTDAMMRSGRTLDWSSLGKPTADKHSTGGIGDKISIPLAPLAASCGCAVPMISGRGLGITGGTLDKLESIPGYSTSLSPEKFRGVLEKTGCSIIGQTDDLAPADKKLYALRDVTGTVPSIPLIASSIMSKKLAEGTGSLVLDVKCGRGAFMKTRDEAKTLARTMIAIGKSMGRRVSALITDMNEPLGKTIGNTVEIEESIRILHGEGPDDVRNLTLELAAEMLTLSGASASREEAVSALEKSIASGRAADTFAHMIEAHGGDPRIVSRPGLMPRGRFTADVPSPRSGFVAGIDADAAGRIVLLLGGGRRKVTDSIDHGVGIERLVQRGEKISEGEPLMRVIASTAEDARHFTSEAARIVSLCDEPPPERRIILDRTAQ